MQHFRAPRWLPGGHLQTIWPALFSTPAPRPPPVYRRERWAAPDGDFVDVDFADAADAGDAAPLLVLFHGLEGSSQSHYALAFAHRARALRLGLCGAALPRLLGRAEPGAARLPLGRLRGDRLDPAAPARTAACAAATPWASRSAATRCCAGPRRPATRPRPRRARWPRCPRRSTWRPAATPSAAASTGRSTRACSCAP